MKTTKLAIFQAGGSENPKNDNAPAPVTLASGDEAFIKHYLALEEQYNNMTLEEKVNAKVQKIGTSAPTSFVSNPFDEATVKRGEELGSKLDTLKTSFTGAQTALITAQGNLTKAQTAVETAKAKMENAQRTWATSPTAGNVGVFQTTLTEYNDACSTYRSVYDVYSKAYDAYKAQENEMVDALADYKVFLTNYNNWRGTIRDAAQIEADLAAMEQRIADQKSADQAAAEAARQAREAKYKAQQAAKPWLEKLGEYLGQISDTTLPMAGVNTNTVVSAVEKVNKKPTAGMQALLDEQALLQEELEWSRYYHYADFANAPDFAEKSKYVPQEDKGIDAVAAALGDYSSDRAIRWEDPLYEAINGNKEAIGWLSNKGASGYSSGGGLGEVYGRKTEDKSEAQQMTQDEIAIFNYLWNTSEDKTAAHNYYNYLLNDLNRREREADAKYLSEYAAKDPVGSSVFSVAMTPLKGLSYVGQVSDLLTTGKIDENAAYNEFANAPNTIRDTIVKKMEGGGVWGKVGSFAYQTGMSMADFLTATVVSGGQSWLAMTIMGSGAAADTTIAAKKRGVDDWRACTLGAISGIAEAVTEKISFDKLFDFGTLKKDALKYYLNNAIPEGLEEGASDLINLFADVLISKDKSEWQMAIDQYKAKGKTTEEAFLAAFGDQALSTGLNMLSGTISGSAMAGGNIAVQGIANRVYSSKLQKAYDLKKATENDAQEIIDSGLESAQDTESYKLAVQLKAKLDAGKIPSAGELGRLLVATDLEIQRENAAAGESVDAAEPEGLSLPTLEDDAQSNAAPYPWAVMSNPVAGLQLPTVAGVAQNAPSVTERGGNVTPAPQNVTADPQNVTENQMINTAVPAGEAVPVAAQSGESQNGGTPYVNTQVRRAAPAAAYSAGGNTGAGGNGLLSGGGQRYAGASAGEQTGSLAGRTGAATQGRDTAFKNRVKAALARETLARDLRLQKVSSAELGFARGTENKNLQILPQEHWDGELQGLAQRIREETGKEPVFVVGEIRVKGKDGKTFPARAAITDRQVILRADYTHKNVSLEQILDHEIFHYKERSARADGYDLNAMIEERILESYTQEELNKVLDAYIDALDGQFGLSEAESAAQYEAALAQIKTELFADAYAGINAFGENTGKFTGAVDESLNRLHLGRNTAQENGVRQTNGPPTVKENTADMGGERYSFHGYAEDGKGIYESNFPKGTPKKAKGERILRYIQDVWSKKPITLRIEDGGKVRYIEAKFDPYYDATEGTLTDARKLMGGNRHGNATEQRVTLDLADDYYQIASESEYNYSKDEIGKNSDPHQGVKRWHYFVNDIYFAEQGSKELTPYRVSINVKENVDGNFFYSFSAEKTEGTSTQRTLHAAVSGSGNAATNGDSSKVSISNTSENVNKKITKAKMADGQEGFSFAGAEVEGVNPDERFSADDQTEVDRDGLRKPETFGVDTSEEANYDSDTDVRSYENNYQEAVPYGQKGKAEDHTSFVRRMREGARRIKQVGGIVFGYTPSRLLYASQTAENTYRELERLGIKCFLHRGLEYNFDGKTYKDPGETGALRDGSVAIYEKAFGDGIEYAGHEAFHVWKQGAERDAYVETLRSNINIVSSVYGLRQANTVLKEYFGDNVDVLGSEEAKAQFQEELYALVSGKIHSGAEEAGLRTMFKDYDAVKSAWQTLIQNKADAKSEVEENFSMDDQTEAEVAAKEELIAALQKLTPQQMQTDMVRQLIEQYATRPQQKVQTPALKIDRANLRRALNSTLGLTKEQSGQLTQVLDKFTQAVKPKRAAKPKAELDVQSKPTEAKKILQKKLLNLFSVPAGQRGAMGNFINNFADRIVKNGKLTEADRKAFFTAMYEAGAMTVPADEYYANARSYIKGGHIFVPDSVVADLGDDWTDLRRRAFAAGIYLTRSQVNENGQAVSGIDAWNNDLASELSGLFNSEETDRRTMLEKIVRVAEMGREERMSLGEYVARIAGEEYTSENDVLDSMEKQMTWALKSFAETARVEIELKDNNLRRVLKERQENKEAAQRAKDRKELQELQKKTMKQLQWLSRNRYKAPEDLQAVWDEVLGDIDLYAIGAANEMNWSEKYGATWKDLAAMYKAAEASDDNFMPSEDLKKIVRRLDAEKIGDMDLGALQDLYKAAVGLRTEFYNRNNVVGDEMHRLFAEVYADVKDEIQNAPGGYTGKRADKFVNMDQLTPMNVLQRMGGWDPDGVFYSMAKQLEHGERDMRAYQVKAQRLLQEFLTEHEDWVKKADGQGKGAVWYEIEVPELLELHMGDKPIFGDTVKVYMTPSQKVHLYLESKNLDNLRHMTGGRTFANKELYSKGKRQEALAQGRTIRLAPETVKQIVSDLTAEELELARLLEQYYNVFAKDEINRVANILYGYDKAMGKNYAPIYTDSNYTKAEFGVFDVTAEGVGNLKGRQHASNPSYNLSAFDAFERHVAHTARFVGMAIPARNWTTLMNWKENGKSTAKVISHKWGDEGVRYITDLITTLQAGDELKTDTISKTVNELQNNYISAVFGANPSIVLKQLGSIPLAGAYLGASNVPSPAQVAKIDKDLISRYTQDLAWRTMGYTTPETKQLKENPNWTQTNKFAKFTFGGGAITAMDGWAASTLWPWAENKVRRDHPELELGTAEQIAAGESPFYKKVAELFEEAVSRSQSVSDEIHQSRLRKSKAPAAKVFTLFRSDSAQTYNTLRQKIGEARFYARTGADGKVKKAAASAVGTAFVALAMNAIWAEGISFLMALWKNKGKKYRDEEEELTAESVMGEMISNVLGSFAGVITGGEEGFELIGNLLTGEKFYDIETPGVEQLKDAINVISESGGVVREVFAGAAEVADNGGDVGEYLRKNSGKILGGIKNLASNAAMYIVGFPAGNLEAYLISALKWASPELGTAYDDLFIDAGKSDLAGLEGGALETRVQDILKDRNMSESEDTAQILAGLYAEGHTSAMPSDTPSSVTVNEEKHELNEYQKQIYDEVWGDVVAEGLDKLVSSEAFIDADQETQAKMLARLYSYAADRAKAELFDQYSSSSAKTVDQMRAEGLDLADCISWGVESSGLKQEEKFALLREWDLTDGQKKAVMGTILGTDLKTVAGNPTRYAEMLEALENGLTVDQYIDLRTDGGVGDYSDLVEGGLDPDEAYELVEDWNNLQPADGKDGVSDLQKWRVCVDFSDDVDDQLTALFAVMTEKQFQKVEIANDFGVTPNAYVTLLELRPRYDANGNGSYTQAEIKKAIDNLPGRYTAAQKAVLWQLVTGSSSAKNNPYDQKTGQKVLAAKSGSAGSSPGSSDDFSAEIMKQLMGE